MRKQRRPGSIKQPDKTKDNKKNGRLHAIPHAVCPATGRVTYVSPRQQEQGSVLVQHHKRDPYWGSDLQYR